MKRRKILQISTTTLQYDGLTKVLFSLIDNCDATIYQNEVVLGKGSVKSFTDRLNTAGISFYEMPDREYKPLSYYLSLTRIIARGNYDVIHVHGNSATMAVELFIAMIFGIKIRIAHSHNTATNHPMIHKLLKPLLNMVTSRPVACGKEAGDFLFPNRRVTIIPNCIDVDKYKFTEETRKAIRKKLNYKDNDFVVGHVGRFRYQKNHEFLIHVFDEYHKNNSTAKLLLIGEDDGKDGTKTNAVDLVNRLGLNDSVLFYGASDHVNEMYQAMDCFLLPSFFEGFGITAIEAQASGLACYLSNQIPHSVRMTERCFFLPLSNDYQIWCEEIEKAHNFQSGRERYASDITNAGYDVKRLPKIIDEVWN